MKSSYFCPICGALISTKRTGYGIGLRAHTVDGSALMAGAELCEGTGMLARDIAAAAGGL